MKEQEEKTVNFPEDDPVSFGIVGDSLYTKHIPEGVEAHDLISAYMLADKLCMGDLQDALMNKLQKSLSDGNNIDLTM